MFRVIAFFLAGVLLSAQALAATGFRQININSAGPRPLSVAVWYPTAASGQIENVGENPAFEGVPVLRGAAPEPGAHPLLLLSHGYGGNWRNLAWLAEDMVSNGYIVAAPDHPGTTTNDDNPDNARKLWLRPEDLVLVMNRIIDDPSIAGLADNARIAAVGHSLGGWTVMALAGARFDPARLLTDCQKHSLLASCRLKDKLGISDERAGDRLSADMRDRRIKAVVSLDLGLARGFTPKSLSEIKIPVLVLAAGSDSAELPAKVESGYLAGSIPGNLVSFEQITGATHFSFMQRCKPQGEALINKSSPGEGIVCRDGGNVGRDKIHTSVAGKISGFLNDALDYHGHSAGIQSASFR